MNVIIYCDRWALCIWYNEKRIRKHIHLIRTLLYQSLMHQQLVY